MSLTKTRSQVRNLAKAFLFTLFESGWVFLAFFQERAFSFEWTLSPPFFFSPGPLHHMATLHSSGQETFIQNTFPDLVELDALRLTVIVDNEVDIMTSVPKELGLTTQAQVLFKDKRHLDKEKSTPTATSLQTAGREDHDHDHGHGHGLQPENGPIRTIGFDFDDLCCGAHGLSILVV